MKNKWRLVHTKQAKKDAGKLTSASKTLRRKAEDLLNILIENPFQTPPSYEKLGGDLMGCYARRINKKHRLVYQILEDERAIKVIRMWTHYE